MRIQFNAKYARMRHQFLMIDIVASDCLVDKSIGEDEQDDRHSCWTEFSFQNYVYVYGVMKTMPINMYYSLFWL